MRKLLAPLEAGAWCVGLLCLAGLFAVRVEAHRTQEAADQIQPIAPISSPQAKHPSAVVAPNTSQDLSRFNGVIGRLEVPALGLTVPVLNDYDPDSLRRGVGRIKGTGVPGGLGNFVVAGHRDTYFRPLRRVRPGMTMRVVTPSATYDYVVDSTTIVLPTNVDVLDIRDRPEMTLITCYPFDYIGAAPKRFIVRSHLVSVAGEPG